MSKGSRRRDAQVSASDVAQRWEQTFGLLDALATPSCDTLTGHMEIRGCEPLPVVGLVPPSSPVTVEPDAT